MTFAKIFNASNTSICPPLIIHKSDTNGYSDTSSDGSKNVQSLMFDHSKPKIGFSSSITNR